MAVSNQAEKWRQEQHSHTNTPVNTQQHTHTLLLLDQQVYKLTPAGVTLTGVLFNAPVVDKTW